MPSHDAPDDDDIRTTYNFAPGYFGLVYREDILDSGTERNHDFISSISLEGEAADPNQGKLAQEVDGNTKSRYKLQAMKWGLVPFWTKRNTDYGSMMRTINCRDDSLATPGGMWNTMKQTKRCIVIAEGFYEWLKKNDGKEKLPHYVKRKDGQLMCFAGLWDCVKYEDTPDKLYTYTIITTSPSEQLKFLHDRMPVILESGSDDIFTWLDSHRTRWSRELQSLLKPYNGDLECYPVVKEVGKVGNNSPTFIVPLDSSANKQNILNFFHNQEKVVEEDQVKNDTVGKLAQVQRAGKEIQHEAVENRPTTNKSKTIESNAPMPLTPRKRDLEDDDLISSHRKRATQSQPHSTLTSQKLLPLQQAEKNTKNTRSAQINKVSTTAKSAVHANRGSEKITHFFKK